MRVNVYAEEMTDRVEIISKTIDGHKFTGLRFYLELPVTTRVPQAVDDPGEHVRGKFVHRLDDDDSSAITFWGKRDLREALAIAHAKLTAHYRDTTKSVDMIEMCARSAHEVNRAYCAALGDASQVPWAEAPEWQRVSARNGVRGALRGNTPEQSHQGWLDEKRAAGWVYGPVKDAEKKTHPCIVPYAELPPEQRMKDTLFLAVVRATAVAFTVGFSDGFTPVHA